jgi:hypothetical protein
MRRSITFAAIAWLILTPLLAHADKPNRTPRPTEFLRSTGQFIAQSAERKATLYDLQGQVVRVFEAPKQIGRIELSADENFVRLSGTEEAAFDIRTGARVPSANFVPVAEPSQTRFHCEMVEDRFETHTRHLELFERSTGEKVRRLGTFERLYPLVWLANGEADILLLKTREGQASVGFYRFDPKTGAFSELFWCPIPGNYPVEFVEHMSFDPDRRIGVKTQYNFVTYVTDLKNGETILKIDNSANYESPYKHLWDTPLGFLSNGELVFALLILGVLLLGVFQSLRFIWNFVIHMATHWPLPPPSQEAKDYGE